MWGSMHPRAPTVIGTTETKVGQSGVRIYEDFTKLIFSVVLLENDMPVAHRLLINRYCFPKPTFIDM